jgi:hypothetical protein
MSLQGFTLQGIDGIVCRPVIILGEGALRVGKDNNLLIACRAWNIFSMLSARKSGVETSKPTRSRESPNRQSL